MTRRRIVTGDEQDVHSRWRRVFTAHHRPGYTSAVKRRTRRRERREGKEDTRQQAREADR